MLTTMNTDFPEIGRSRTQVRKILPPTKFERVKSMISKEINAPSKYAQFGCYLLIVVLLVLGAKLIETNPSENKKNSDVSSTIGSKCENTPVSELMKEPSASEFDEHGNKFSLVVPSVVVERNPASGFSSTSPPTITTSESARKQGNAHVLQETTNTQTSARPGKEGEITDVKT